MLHIESFIIVIIVLTFAFLFLIQPEKSWIYFMTLIVQQANTIKDITTTFHWYCQPNLISVKKLFKKLFDNFLCLIINHDFYSIINLWEQYTLFITAFRRKIFSSHQIFLFLLKKVPNISNCSAFNCFNHFIFWLFSLFLVFLIY